MFFFNKTATTEIYTDWHTLSLHDALPIADTLDIILRADISHQDQKGNPRHNNCDTSFNGGIHCVGINPDPRVVNAYIDGEVKRTIQTYSAEANIDLPFGTLTNGRASGRERVCQ